MIDGRLKLDSWSDKTSGEKRSRLKVVTENFQFIGSRDEAGGATRAEGVEGGDYNDVSPASRGPAKKSAPANDDDVPF
jgi:single-strand DNA-binding protein